MKTIVEWVKVGKSSTKAAKYTRGNQYRNVNRHCGFLVDKLSTYKLGVFCSV